MMVMSAPSSPSLEISLMATPFFPPETAEDEAAIRSGLSIYLGFAMNFALR